MRRLRILSFTGIVCSLLAHLVSWTTPNIIQFTYVGIPLHIVAMLIVAHLYKKSALPLQDRSGLRWINHASSWIHGLMFLAALSFMFHTIVMVLQLSVVLMYFLRAVSSIWLYVYAAGYGYATWASQYHSGLKDPSHLPTHRHQFRQRADTYKPDIQVDVPPVLRKRY